MELGNLKYLRSCGNCGCVIDFSNLSCEDYSYVSYYEEFGYLPSFNCPACGKKFE